MFDPQWVCKDGRRIKVAEMNTDHINNAIRLILRCRRWRRNMLPRLYLELEIRALQSGPC